LTISLVARGRLLRVFEQVEVPVRIAIAGSMLTTHSVPWDAFWYPVVALESAEIKRSVQALREAWLTYVRSGFRRDFAREYCCGYFILLGQLVRLCRPAPVDAPARAALQAALSFECVGVFDETTDRPVAAGTTTLRNPCYLLAKLKHPSALDDPQFLPFVTAPTTAVFGCFYQYRQHKLSTDSGLSLLLYLNPGDPRSFPAVNALEARVADGTDPRADEQAARIADGILIPYLKGASCLGSNGSERPREIELLDLGSGSGILAAKLCQMVEQSCRCSRERVRFRAYLLDIAPGDPTRFFRTASIRVAVDSLTCISSDYRDWLGRPYRLPPRRGIRLAIASRFFNNLSEFAVTAINSNALGAMTGLGNAGQWWPDCIPSLCLRSTAVGPSSLVVSNKRIWLPEGRSFVQASLSPYFEGLHMLLPDNVDEDQRQHDANNVFLPLRSFRKDCLLTARGSSVLAELLGDCALVVVNDADLRPTDLIAHAERYPIPGSAAIDMTRSLRLKGHFTYAIGRAADSAMSQLKGQRLW
jgi:hypothetical protein